jgi:hypothetical protein
MVVDQELELPVSPFSKFDVSGCPWDTPGDMTKFSISPADACTKSKADPRPRTALSRDMSAELMSDRLSAADQRLDLAGL